MKDITPTRATNDKLALDHMSTKMASDVLAAETRAFGNKAAQLKLQMATEAFLQAKKTLQQASTASGKITQEEK